MKLLKEPYTRDIAYLNPSMQTVFPAFLKEVKFAGIPMIITCTARLIKCQVALYAQGRQSLEEINNLRKISGMVSINAVEAKKKVTWTLFSEHLINCDNTDPNDDYSDAFDFAIMQGKGVSYDVKVNINKNQISDYEEVGIIAEKFGWEWGGRWKKSPDYPHIQLRT